MLMSETLSPELQSWVGRMRVVEEDVSLGAVRRIASMLDLDPDGFRRGDALPPHWFTLFCAETPRQSDIGPDGHPKPGVVLPPIPLPRRMGAGRRVRIPGVLRIGDVAVKTAEVAAIVPKQARTGFITVLTMRHTIRVNDAVVAVDEFDAVYREAVKPGEKSAVTPPNPAPSGADWNVTQTLTSPLVFRYSAIAWNAHRIHYDADYSRTEEGYPNTVQNGGLTMQLLLDAMVAHTPGRLTGFTARLTRPLYVGETVHIRGRAPADGLVTGWVEDRDGNQNALIEAQFA
jgi:3-methylfumaryl-CoA hydratase